MKFKKKNTKEISIVYFKYQRKKTGMRKKEKNLELKVKTVKNKEQNRQYFFFKKNIK